MSKTEKPWAAEWAALRERSELIASEFADPYGIDSYQYDLAKKADPEHVRLLAAFIEARRKAQA